MSHHARVDTPRICDDLRTDGALRCQPVQRMRRSTECAMLRDMPNNFAKVVETDGIAVQHAKRLAVVHSDTNPHACFAVFVDDAGNLETDHLCGNYSVFDHYVSTRSAEGVRKSEVGYRWFAPLGVRSRHHRHEV
ncbi:MAG: hypothetical protein RL072_891 [Actinomycetota bacterium]